MVKIFIDSTTGTELISRNVQEEIILHAHGRPKGKLSTFLM